MLALASDVDDPFSRNHFVPGHFTASGFVVSPDGDALLLVHHRRLDRWLQPGGHIDPEDRDPIVAAAREVREETAVTLAEPLPTDLFDIDVHAIPAARGEPAHAHFDLRFLFHAETDEFEADDEVMAAAWVPIDEIAAGWEDASVQRVAARMAATAGRPRHRRKPS
jgi:8-oxo-dGTP pyrophosphatase MutT (NUDIX family)